MSTLQPARQRLIDEIVAEFAQTAGHTGIPAPGDATLRALARVDRARFVAAGDESCAWVDRPLGIGHGQTISQPYIVALMTELLELDATSRVLEIGTGSGYQAAILGEIAAEVYSIEIVPELARQAADLLTSLGYRHIHVRCGNGREGWPEQAPFDAIVVTAAADGIPPALLGQLAPGGVMAIPVNTSPWGQTLKRIRVDENGASSETDILPVVFVPLTGAP
jgi:protein-L-isoaspartate(D-aspartate) O-methyltransferase